MKQNDITDMLTIDLEVLGLGLSLSPFSDKISSNRNGMFATALSQYQIPKHPESPNIFTGYENTLEDYEYNFGTVENDFKVLEIIPKFSNTINNLNNPIENVPLYYVFGIDLIENELTYYEVKSFHKLNEKYGYQCQPIDINDLNKYQTLDKGTKLYTSIAHDTETGEYKFGCNVNVMFATMLGTVEDAFIISDEVVKKLSPEGYESIKIKVSVNEYPLNLYGTKDNYKIFPDLGEKVRQDGIITAFRYKDNVSMLQDFSEENIYHPNHLLDLVFYTENDAEVVDIDIFMNNHVKHSVSQEVFNQVFKYHDAKLESYRKIIQFYLKHKDTYSISRKLNTLLTYILQYLYIHDIGFIKKNKIYNKKKNIKLSGEIEENDIFIILTVKYPKYINIGSKITGRDGAKGVVGSIQPKEFMPKDKNGFTADLVIDPISLIARNNIGQAYEQFINRISEIVINRYVNNNKLSLNDKFNQVIEYINLVNPNQAKIIQEHCKTDEDIQEYLDYISKNGIKLQIISGMKNIDTNFILLLNKLYNGNITPITYKYIDRKTDTIKTVTTKNACCIGKKFVILVYNEPEISAVNIGCVNSFAVPTTVPRVAKNYAYPVKINCVRFGEDEFRMMLDTLGPEVTLRIRELSTSLQGLETIVNTILTAEHPSDIPHFPISNKELLNSDTMVNVIHTICYAFGLDLINVKCDSKDIEYYHKLISKNQELLYYETDEILDLIENSEDGSYECNLTDENEMED